MNFTRILEVEVGYALSPRDLLTSGIEPRSPQQQGDSHYLSHQEAPCYEEVVHKELKRSWAGREMKNLLWDKR